MQNFNFYEIFNHTEFQDFARDIIQIRENITFEGFGKGRDGAMDGRYINLAGNTTVLQVKHYKVHNISHLKKEAERINKIEPERYILVLSYDILPKTKSKIMTLFHPYIENVNDIVTNADLNNLIGDISGKYKGIKDKYSKLWTFCKETLQETFKETLQTAISNVQNDAVDWELYDKSAEYLELALEDKQYFVETELYWKAIEKVLGNQVVVISGEPGMGKTTLGMQLALYLLEKCKQEGKQEVRFYWVETISTLRRALCKGKDEEWKIIIYDDFWGSILFRESDRGQEEEELGRILNKIQREKKVFFILTTRHYILEQGLKGHEDIRKVIDENKLECRLVDYSDGEKQEIFYEHIVKGNLMYEQAVALFKSAIVIIKSPNYNPRVIDIFTKDISEKDIPEDLPKKLERFLDKPKEFWEKIFNNLTEEAKYLYKVLTTMPDNVASEYVEKVYIKGAELYNRLKWKEYSKVIAELEKTVIRTNTTSNGTIFIQFQNPSMREMIENYLEENLVQNERTLLGSCIYYQQAVKLLKRLRSAERYDAFYSGVMEKALEVFETEDIDIIRRDRGKAYYKKRKYPEPDNELPRYLEICKLYKANVCHKWKEKCKQFLKQYLRMIVMFPHDIPHRCISTFPSVTVHALKEGLLHEFSDLLEIYKMLVMRNGMELDYEVFMEFDQKCCMEHIEKYRVEIEDYIAKYYDFRLCLAAADNDEGDFTDYLVRYEEAKELLRFFTKNQLDDAIDVYDSWIDEDTSRNREPYVKRDSHERTFEEIESEYWNKYFVVENSDEDMNLIMSPEKEHFLDIEYHLKKIFYRINGTTEVPTENLVDILTELGCSYYEMDRKVWRRTDIEQICLDNLGFEMKEEQLEQLVNHNILIPKSNWFFIKNKSVFFVAFLYQFYFGEGRNRKEDYYQLFLESQEEEIDSVIFLGKQLYYDNCSHLITAMKLIDKDIFEKYVVFESAKNFYEEAYAVEQEQLVENLLDAFQYEIEVDSEGMVCGGIYMGYPIVDIIGVEKDFHIGEIIPAQFTKEQLGKIRYDSLEENIGFFSLMQLEKLGMLKTTGIEDGLLKFWKIILEYIEESKYE